MLRRLRPLTEHECYLRCYRIREPTVRVLPSEPRRLSAETRLSGDDLRRLFQERLEARRPEAA